MASTTSILIAAALLSTSALLICPAQAAERSFSVTTGNCTFSLEFGEATTARGPELTAERVVSDACNLDFPEEAKDVDLLLAQAERAHINLSLLRGLAWRAMHERTLVERAAKANLRSYGGRNIGEREFTVLLKKSDAFSELVNVFKKHGLKLTIEGVEEAEAYTPKDLQSEGIDLPISKPSSKRKTSITAGAELLWFNVARAQ